MGNDLCHFFNTHVGVMIVTQMSYCDDIKDNCKKNMKIHKLPYYHKFSSQFDPKCYSENLIVFKTFSLKIEKPMVEVTTIKR